ncbi:DUF4199 domain-containing protein [Sphingomonas parva]|nr:DUF4199 domain-containing protein [Sphingomonas parva]
MRYVLVYGGLAGAIVISVLCASFALELPNHTSSLWFGYLVMLVALSLIFVGVKRYRDVECGGVIRFGRALGLGLGIAALAGVVYVIGWELYLAMTGWDFMAEYGASIVQGMRAKGASAAAIAAKTEELRGYAEMYRNPVYRTAMTFAEIFPVGLVVAFVSAAVLRNPRMLPARA